MAALVEERPRDVTEAAMQSPREVQDAVKTLADIGDWLKALALLVPRFGSLNLCDEALNIIRELKSNARLALYFGSQLFGLRRDDLIEDCLIKVIPFLNETHLGQAAELSRSVTFRGRTEVKLLLREAELGLYNHALEKAFRMGDSADRARALTGLIPYLSEQILSERRTMSIRGRHRPVEPQKEDIEATSTSSRDIERPLLELALLAAARFETHPGFSDTPDERLVMLSSLAPYLTRLPAEALYNVWCELLPLLAARSRLSLTEDLRVLIAVLDSLAGMKALAEVRKALMTLNRCLP